MKNVFVIAALALAMPLMAQDNEQKTDSVEEGFRFTTVDSVGISPVKNQNRSSTCWAFSTNGFLESEVMRMNKGKIVDFSDMYVVSKTMMDRAEYCVRMYGDVAFAPGGSAYDVLYCLKNYGLVPQDAMPGIRYGVWKSDTLPVHNELDAVAGGLIKALKGQKKITPVWKEAMQAIYNTYLGACPTEFTYEGKTYTPQEWTKSLGLNADDYVSFTSFTHHPFYTQFAVEVPDNWRMDQMYNVPVEDLIRIVDNAISKGYTAAWGADVSEMGFTRKGIGVVIDPDKAADLTGSDMARWLGKSDGEKKEDLTRKPLPEMEITQQLRQVAFDTWETTDDHGMQIFGVAKDQNGKPYFLVKNSWGTEKSTYKGIWYISRAFFMYKTIDIVVHKDAVPADLRKKLGIK